MFGQATGRSGCMSEAVTYVGPTWLQLPEASLVGLRDYKVPRIQPCEFCLGQWCFFSCSFTGLISLGVGTKFLLRQPLKGSYTLEGLTLNRAQLGADTLSYCCLEPHLVVLRY